MNKTLKVMLITVMVAITVCFIGNTVWAADGSAANTFSKDQAPSAVKSVGNKIFSIVYWIAVLIGLIMVTMNGVKYMMASPEGKAEYKKTLIPLVLGLALVFAAKPLVNYIQGEFENFNF